MNDVDKPVVGIIDDDPAVRDSLISLVECGGYAAVAFSSAEQFLQRGSLPEAVFLIVDVRLPGMSGVELLDRLASAGLAKPAAVITGHADSEELRQAPHLSGVRVFTKPADPGALLQVIAAAAGPAT